MEVAWLLDRAVRMRIAGGLFALWGVSAHMRCLDRANRRRLAAVAAAVCAWMLLVIVKWKAGGAWFSNLPWYAYYIPITCLPLLCLLIAARASGLDRRPWARPASRLLWAAAAALAALVLTNDLHEQVFGFQGLPRSDIGPYEYRWGYWVVAAWSAACYLGFFAASLSSARKRLRPLFAPVAVVCLAGAAFCLGYVRRAPWAFSLNFSLVYSALIVLTLELCLDFGIIASARSFAPLFAGLPLDLKVLDLQGGVYRATDKAAPLDPDVREHALSLERGEEGEEGAAQPARPPLPGSGAPADKAPRSRASAGKEGAPAHRPPRGREGGAPAGRTCSWARAAHGGVPAGRSPARRAPSSPRPATFSLASRPGKLYRVWRLSGALALLTQDTSDLDAISRALGQRRAALERTNEMLRRRQQVAGALERLSSEQRLMDEVEAAISSSLARLRSALAGLPAGGSDAEQAARVRELRRARLVLGYCKRKSSLVLFESADPEVERDRVRLIASELAGDLRAVGIDAAAVADVSRNLPAGEMSVLYDCIYGVALLAFECESPVLLVYLGELEGGFVELRASLQSDDPNDLALRPQACGLPGALRGHGVACSLSGGAGELRLVARVGAEGPREERPDGTAGRHGEPPAGRPDPGERRDGNGRPEEARGWAP